MKHALCIGKLTHLEVVQPGGSRPRVIRLRDRWLAWDPAKKRFHICRVTGHAGVNPSRSVAKAHQRFHSAAPKGGSFTAQAPDEGGRLTEVGLLRSLVYEVPNDIRSPDKNRYKWHHAFGDTGHKGGTGFPERVMPALKRTASGDYVIVRRPGNVFRVDSWLRG